MNAYSVDLRQQVADAVLQDGLPWAQVARLFRLSIASVGRFVLARRRGQDLTLRHSSGRPRRLDSPERLEALRAQLRAELDLSLVERCERLRQGHGIQINEATLSRVLRRVLGWSKKISLNASERDEAERAAWRARAEAEVKGKRWSSWMRAAVT